MLRSLRWNLKAVGANERFKACGCQLGGGGWEEKPTQAQEQMTKVSARAGRKEGRWEHLEKTQGEEEGGAKEPEGSTPVPGMAAEAGRQRPPGVWGGVHREVEEAFTIQRIYHLSREAFSEYPPPLPWTVLVLWLRVLTCLWDLTHLTRSPLQFLAGVLLPISPAWHRARQCSRKTSSMN